METQFLKELIENNARVILPEFGAFLVKDDGTGVFKPQNVTFSPFLRYNDGMVEEQLATKLKLSKDQAKEKLESFIEMLKSELQSKKIFVIQGLGSLQIDSRGSIQFSTLQSASSAAKASPKPAAAPSPPEAKPKPAEPKAEKPKPAKPTEPILPKSKEPVKKAEEQPKAAEPKPKATEETPPPPAPIEEPKPVAPKQPKPTPMPKQKSSSGAGKAILFGTLIGIGVVVVAASGWYLYDKGVFSSKKKEKVVPTAERVATEPSDQQKQDQQKGKFEDEFEQLSAEMDESNDVTRSEQTAKPAEKKISKSPTTTEPRLSIPVTQEGMFHIVAGSFRNAEYAEKFSRDMQSLGYNSKVIMQSTGMHAVTLGSFLTRQQAVDSMNVWKQKNPNIWILNQ